MIYKHSNPRWWRDYDAEGRAWSEAENDKSFGPVVHKEPGIEIRTRHTFIGSWGSTMYFLDMGPDFVEPPR